MRLLSLLDKHQIHVKEFCEIVKPDLPIDEVYLMKGKKVLAKLNASSVEQWVTRLDENVESILSLLKADGADPKNKEASLKSISETCMPKKLTNIYLEFIYESRIL